MRIAVLDDYANLFKESDGPALLAGHEVTVFRDAIDSEQVLIDRLQPFEAVLLTQQRTRMPASVIAALPNLRMLSQTGNHKEHIDLALCAERGIDVRFSGKGQQNPTVELTWALILASVRNLPYEAARLKAGHWQSTAGMQLGGKILGVYAHGRMGSRVAKIGAAMEMKILCLGRGASLESAAAAGHDTTTDRARFFSEADIVTLHMPLNDHTAGIVTAADLALMKPTAHLINTSRAGLVAPGVLYDAVKAGRPGFAAADVFEREPVLGASDKLLSLDQFLGTPHLGYSVREQIVPFLGRAAGNIARHIAERSGEASDTRHVAQRSGEASDSGFS
jgi:D-3-phosphoglycerate dehydrogenase